MNYVNAGYVYAIENTQNGGMYIGSTVDYKGRWHTHRSTLRNKRHHSFVLQRAWDKYGEAAFRFRLLLICSKEHRIMYETALMPLQRYNVLRTPKESMVRGGWEHSDEFKQKMSSLHKGKALTEAHRQKLSAHRTGMKMDSAFCEKARLRQTGVSPTAKTRTLLSAATKAARAGGYNILHEKVMQMYPRYMLGESAGVLSVEFGMSTQAFWRHYRAEGLPSRRKTRRKEAV